MIYLTEFTENLLRNRQLLGSISLSCGISLYPKHETNAESLIQLADQALYQAKQAGRDQVVVANSH